MQPSQCINMVFSSDWSPYTIRILILHAAEIKNENNKERRLKMLMNFKLKVHNEYAKVKSTMNSLSLTLSTLVLPQNECCMKERVAD